MRLGVKVFPVRVEQLCRVYISEILGLPSHYLIVNIELRPLQAPTPLRDVFHTLCFSEYVEEHDLPDSTNTSTKCTFNAASLFLLLLLFLHYTLKENVDFSLDYIHLN